MKLSDRIIFHMKPQTIGSDNEAVKLMKRIKDAAKLDARFDDRIERICVMVSCTDEIEFRLDEGTPHAALLRFRDDWANRAAFKTEDWVRFVLDLAIAIINEWLDQWKLQQELPDLDPAQLPPSKLTAEQQEEITHPGSPLGDGERSSGNPSLGGHRASGAAASKRSRTKASSAPISS